MTGGWKALAKDLESSSPKIRWKSSFKPGEFLCIWGRGMFHSTEGQKPHTSKRRFLGPQKMDRVWGKEDWSGPQLWC